MADLIEQIRTMPNRKKGILAVVVVLVVTAGILMSTWLQKADYQLLFANLSEEDAGAIILKLGEMKVPYTTTAGGIMVPVDKVYELRIQLAGQGLPQGGGVGFELFDKTSFTMTDFVQKLNYRRALQGELSRTIRSLAEVEQCRIHLAVPEKTLFVQKDDKPKASILLKLRPGKKLSQGQIQGIVHLVASSIENLDARDVSVVDSNGDMLTSTVDEAFAASSGQLDHQRTFEKEMEGRIISMLEPVVGAGKVKARVSASFDFTKTEKTEEKYDPESQVVRSEQRAAEKSSSGNAAGVPGVASNLPQRATPQAASSQALTEKKNETVNYEISKTVSHIVSPSGEIKRLSVVVLVDGTYAAAQGGTEKKYTPRSEDEVRQFEDMVKKAVGFATERNDEVKVVNMPFEVIPVEEFVEQKKGLADMMPQIMAVLKYLAPLAGVVLLFLFVIRPLMTAVTSPSMGGRQFGSPQAMAELQQGMSAPAARETSTQDKLVDWAKNNPKDATNLIKGWLEEK